jgi:hypothetical protein
MRLAVIAAVRGVLATYAVGSAPSYKTTSASCQWCRVGHRGVCGKREKVSRTHRRYSLIASFIGGQGRDRTGDLPLFRRTLIPTELPGRKAPMSYPSASPNTGDPDGT